MKEMHVWYFYKYYQHLIEISVFHDLKDEFSDVKCFCQFGSNLPYKK